MAKVTGYVIERGMGLLAHRPIPVAAVANLPAFPSQANVKTGPALTVSYLPLAEPPHVAAHRTGLDEAVCGDCKMRPLSPSLAKDGCYVLKNYGINNVWKKLTAGGYPEADAKAYEVMMKAEFVRFGGWGDSACLPEGHVERFADIPKRAGYTHQFMRPVAAHLRRWLMASTDSPEERDHAKDLGWRSFRVRLPGAKLLKGEIDCPYPRVQCYQCGACDGAVRGRRKPDISVEAHGVIHKIAAITRFQESL